ncbi:MULTISPECIES: hypothetical protein [unclassified Kitasatospora]|uniref:hypothetical protein n=1 Tax=unclassified Kitasatospora TaxID=2633591 RepID=UPI00070E76B1|nr:MULTISPECIES: hypothetical protein [unclassified Kitasatospora]KQV19226.1 hypothetical protein ASC99_24030 [Kitasatospora sp. Root107]KRB77502.1 hypothetical protein ASE03_00230 [Kitasatospora sp. Root187]
MAWFGEEFGRAPLERAPVLPTAQDFPGTFEGSPAEIRGLVRRLCGPYGLNPDRLVIEVESSEQQDGEQELAAAIGAAYASTGAAGHFRWDEDGRPVVSINQAQGRHPVSLVATIAHELGHVLLLGSERLTKDASDGEELTDLLTVYFGFGVFSANSVFTRSVYDGRVHTSSLGYLSEEVYGYALACWTILRGDPDPVWARHLDTNPRGYLRQGLRHLKDRGPT